MSHIDGLQIRRVLGRREWQVPQPFGDGGWMLGRVDGLGSVVASQAEIDGTTWIHASIARTHEMPSYEDLTRLHTAVFGDRWAYQVFAPPAHHVNIHRHALHLWGRADGAEAIPNFGIFGTI